MIHRSAAIIIAISVATSPALVFAFGRGGGGSGGGYHGSTAERQGNNSPREESRIQADEPRASEQSAPARIDNPLSENNSDSDAPRGVVNNPFVKEPASNVLNPLTPDRAPLDRDKYDRAYPYYGYGYPLYWGPIGDATTTNPPPADTPAP